MTIEFTIPGDPKGKQRPRVTRTGHAYTPAQTVNYENLVKLMYADKYKETMLEGEIQAEIVGYFQIPKSTSKKKKEEMLEGRILHTKKIDCDNLAKIILDSLNGISYHDDSQVCRLYVEKRYSENPRVVVRLSEVEHK